MRAFVTGSTGLLGNNLVRILLNAGHEVWALARSKEKAQRELGDTAARVVLGDIRNVANFAYELRGIDAIFHTAAYFREYYNPGDHSNAIELTNVKGTMELAQAAHAMGVRKMIYPVQPASSDCSLMVRLGMSRRLLLGAAKNLYLDSKRRTEQWMREFSREKGFFVASALPSWTWGPHDVRPTPSGQLVLDAIAHKLPPLVPPGGSAVVDARDVATGMLRIAEIGCPGERYILSGTFVELGDLLANLAALTGATAPTRRIRFAAALALATGVETWSRITRTTSPMSVEAIRLMNARLRVTSVKAEKKLGAAFRSFTATLADTVSWAQTTVQRMNSRGAPALSASKQETV